MRHCNDYIDDPDAPIALRAFLERALSLGHGMLSSAPYPELYADFEGRRCRVVMASRLGDVGITFDLDREIGTGYEARVLVEHLANFSETP